MAHCQQGRYMQGQRDGYEMADTESGHGGYSVLVLNPT
jgi:hypothetical protein